MEWLERDPRHSIAIHGGARWASESRSCSYLAALLIFTNVCTTALDALNCVDSRRTPDGSRAVEWLSHRRFVERFARWRRACFVVALPLPMEDVPAVALPLLRCSTGGGGVGEIFPAQLRSTLIMLARGARLDVCWLRDLTLFDALICTLTLRQTIDAIRDCLHFNFKRETVGSIGGGHHSISDLTIDTASFHNSEQRGVAFGAQMFRSFATWYTGRYTADVLEHALGPMLMMTEVRIELCCTRVNGFDIYVLTFVCMYMLCIVSFFRDGNRRCNTMPMR